MIIIRRIKHNISSDLLRRRRREGTNVYAVFHGYLKWDKKAQAWKEDEWLTQIYGQLRKAKEAIENFANGQPFDNERELQVTRYFGKSNGLFDPGQELSKDDPRVVMHEWMRYAVYTILD